MERRDFIKVSLGFAAAAVGTAVMAVGAEAAPLLPQPLSEDGRQPLVNKDARSAVTTADEASQLRPEEVHWHGRHWGWRHRHWGWRHRWHRW